MYLGGIISTFGSFDISCSQILPRSWRDDIAHISTKYSIKQVLDGSSETSREEEGGGVVEISVVTGDIIFDKLPWLYLLYSTSLLDLASKVAQRRLFIATDIKSSININRISGIGGRYEWHVDSNPITGLFFVSTLQPEDGGALVFSSNGTNLKLYPCAGTFLAFDARDIPHRVEPLLKNIVRLSVPMNYYFCERDQVRPVDLQNYLYSGE